MPKLTLHLKEVNNYYFQYIQICVCNYLTKRQLKWDKIHIKQKVP